MLDQLRSLAVFARVAELGSFRAAARSLALSPSVVSHHVSALEHRLALPLLYRSTRRLALTPDGEKLLSFARDMVDAAARGLDSLSGRGESAQGTLRLTAPAFLAETALCGDLAAFSGAHPNVDLSVSFSDAPRDLLRDGFDLALRIGRLADSTHKTRKLAEMRRRLVASPRYLRQRRLPRTPRDLKTWDLIHLSSRPPEITLHSPRTKKPTKVALAPRISVDSAAAMRELVRSGLGIAALPDVLIAAEIERGHLVEILPGWLPQRFGVYAVWPSNPQRAGLTQRFIDFMASRIKRLFEGAEP